MHATSIRERERERESRDAQSTTSVHIHNIQYTSCKQCQHIVLKLFFLLNIIIQRYHNIITLDLPTSRYIGWYRQRYSTPNNSYIRYWEQADNEHRQAHFPQFHYRWIFMLHVMKQLKIKSTLMVQVDKNHLGLHNLKCKGVVRQSPQVKKYQPLQPGCMLGLSGHKCFYFTSSFYNVHQSSVSALIHRNQIGLSDPLSWSLWLTLSPLPKGWHWAEQF
jgi:hypothetical protein